MTIQQLEYIVMVDTHRHFVTAAKKCFVTQATLSMMIKKLEEELGVIIFDRSKQPVVPTEMGSKILLQARTILQEKERLKEIIHEEKEDYSGELKIGIIPTLSLYLLPLFLKKFLAKHPRIKLQIHELTTKEILSQLNQHQLDAGIIASSIGNSGCIEEHLFYEEFVVYSSEKNIPKPKAIAIQDIDVNQLWLLEDGHCFRSQIIHLCDLKNRADTIHQLNFSTGSLEMIRKIVDMNQGITILPILALSSLTAKQKKHVLYFKKPVPVREISLITIRYFVKQKLLASLKNEILQSIPSHIKEQAKREIEIIKA